MARICQMSHVEATFNFLAPLFRLLRDEGHEVTAACAMDEGGAGLRRHLGTSGYGSVRVPLSRRLHPGTLGTDLLTLSRLLRGGRYDLLHLHGPMPGLQGRLAAHLAGVPRVVYQAHGFWFHDAMPAWQRLPATALEWALGRLLTDRLVVVNAEDESLARRWRFRPGPDEVLRVPGVGVDTDRFRPARVGERANRERERHLLGLPTRGTLVAFVGRLVREKGVRELVEAMEPLLDRHPDLHLVLVGEALPSDRDRETAAWLRRRAARRPDRIVLLGRSEAVARILRVVDLFCLPSHREGMPVALLEAMATGLPCVVTAVRGSREALGTPPAGRCVPVGNREALARELTALLEDPPAAAALGATARSRVEARYDLAKAMEPLRTLYRELLPPPSRTSS
jgi:glycosyltransferase involved in cell wall biosynthesis